MEYSWNLTGMSFNNIMAMTVEIPHNVKCDFKSSTSFFFKSSTTAHTPPSPKSSPPSLQAPSTNTNSSTLIPTTTPQPPSQQTKRPQLIPHPQRLNSIPSLISPLLPPTKAKGHSYILCCLSYAAYGCWLHHFLEVQLCPSLYTGTLVLCTLVLISLTLEG